MFNDLYPISEIPNSNRKVIVLSIQEKSIFNPITWMSSDRSEKHVAWIGLGSYNRRINKWVGGRLLRNPTHWMELPNLIDNQRIK